MYAIIITNNYTDISKESIFWFRNVALDCFFNLCKQYCYQFRETEDGYEAGGEGYDYYIKLKTI